MKNFHLISLSFGLIITTVLLRAGCYLISLFMLLVLYLQAFLGFISCILDLLDIFLSHDFKNGLRPQNKNMLFMDDLIHLASSYTNRG